MPRFSNKIAVVTGGGSGIGLAAARRLADEGATVVIVGRHPEAVKDAAKAIGGAADLVTADVTKMDDLDRLFAEVRERHGRIDILFANAGNARLGPVSEMAPELFDEVMEVNFKGTYYTVQKALPLIQDGGSIIFTSSWFTEVGLAGTSVVSASKAAVRSLVRTLASELVNRNIRVNSISPGVIETPLFGKLGLSEAAVQELGASLLGTIPMKRFGRAEEVASVVAFLASDDASYITGIDLPVDGGRTQL
jgi:NAD(P)-dependent dehydrogenase (short-subunit alcohol dehydrogenase family)